MTVKKHMILGGDDTYYIIKNCGHYLKAPLADSKDDLLKEEVGAIDTASVEDWNRVRTKLRAPEYIIRKGKKVKVRSVQILHIEEGWFL